MVRSQKAWFPLSCGPGRWFPELVFFDFFSKVFFFDFFRCWVDFGRVWEAKMEAKIDFSDVFFHVFFECVFASILGGFLEARKLKNQ